jgi:putative transposase
MTAKPYPTDLTDAEWDLIKELIPPPKPGGRHRELDMRAVVKARFYVVDGGIKWRMLPHSNSRKGLKPRHDREFQIALS